MLAIRTTVKNEQYTLWQIFVIWLFAGAPMWLLGWVTYPALSKGLSTTDAGATTPTFDDHWFDLAVRPLDDYSLP